MLYGILALLIVLAILAGVGTLIFLLVRKFVRPVNNPAQSDRNTYQDITNNMNESLTLRSIIVGVIALVMLIPLALMHEVVHERNNLYRDVLYDIANSWGGQQLLQGPVLVIPFIEKHVSEETTTDEQGREKVKSKTTYVTKYAVNLPKELNLDVSLSEQHRKRGIYKSLVYNSEISVNGNFEKVNIESLSEHIHQVNWDKAFLILGLSDTRAINQVNSLNWNGMELGFSPGTKLTELLSHGFHADIAAFDQHADRYEFSTKMSVNGSEGFRFAPFGEVTKVTMQSSWPHPSFKGMVLPATREIRDDGFVATWSIPHLARNFPQTWVAPTQAYNLNEFVAGVDLFEPVFLYSKVTRAVKYGILFVGLTFLTFLIFELTTQSRLHFVQYGLIGIALALFYLVLLSIAEHVSFLTAYILAALINIGLITIYTAAALKSWSKAGIIFILLTALYIVLYSLLRLEDYALLMGTMLLLLVLMVLMYVTRNLRVDTS